MKLNYNTTLILNFIKNNNLTKKEFCKLCKLSKTSFYNILSNRNVSTLSMLKVAIFMKVKLKDLVFF